MPRVPPGPPMTFFHGQFHVALPCAAACLAGFIIFFCTIKYAEAAPFSSSAFNQYRGQGNFMDRYPTINDSHIAMELFGWETSKAFPGRSSLALITQGSYSRARELFSNSSRWFRARGMIYHWDEDEGGGGDGGELLDGNCTDHDLVNDDDTIRICTSDYAMTCEKTLTVIERTRDIDGYLDRGELLGIGIVFGLIVVGLVLMAHKHLCGKESKVACEARDRWLRELSRRQRMDRTTRRGRNNDETSEAVGVDDDSDVMEARRLLEIRMAKRNRRFNGRQCGQEGETREGCAASFLPSHNDVLASTDRVQWINNPD